MSTTQTFMAILSVAHTAHNGRIGLSFSPEAGDAQPVEITMSILPATDTKGGIAFNSHQFVPGKTYQLVFTQTN